MASWHFWRDVRRRWDQLNRKGLGLGAMAVLLLFEGVKSTVATILPPGYATAVGFLFLGSVLTVYYLLREVDLEDAKEAASEGAEKVKGAAESGE